MIQLFILIFNTMTTTSIRNILQNLMHSTQEADSKLSKKWRKVAKEKHDIEVAKNNYKSKIDEYLINMYVKEFLPKYFDHPEFKHLQKEITDEDFATKQWQDWRTYTVQHCASTIDHKSLTPETGFKKIEENVNGFPISADSFACQKVMEYVKYNPDALDQWKTFDSMKRCNSITQRLNTSMGDKDHNFRCSPCDLFENVTFLYFNRHIKK